MESTWRPQPGQLTPSAPHRALRLGPPPSNPRAQRRYQGPYSLSSSLESSSPCRPPSPSRRPARTQDVDNQRLRRKISALEDTVNRLRSAGGSSKKSRADSPYQPGRGIRKIADLYHDLPELLSKAGKHAAMISESLDPTEMEIDQIDFVGLTEDQIEEERKDRKRCHTAVQILNKLIPGFEDNVNASDNLTLLLTPVGTNYTTDHSLKADLLIKLQTGANDARSDDTCKLKVAIADWLNARKYKNSSSGDGDDSETNDSNHNTPFLSPKGKDDRGISNDITGRLICPIDYDWDDPDVRVKLRNGEPNFNMASSFFLRCLYEKGKGNPNSPEDGFLKGTLLVRAFRQIFTSPSSAYNENEASEVTSRRRDVASTLGLNSQVTPRAIAYTATQLVFSLNTSRDWRHEHAGFHYPSFYNFIVDFFEDAEDDISKEANTDLLNWWNRQVFPPSANRSAVSIPSTSSQKRLREFRARRARMASGNGRQQPRPEQAMAAESVETRAARSYADSERRLGENSH